MWNCGSQTLTCSRITWRLVKEMTGPPPPPEVLIQWAWGRAWSSIFLSSHAAAAACLETTFWTLLLWRHTSHEILFSSHILTPFHICDFSLEPCSVEMILKHFFQNSITFCLVSNFGRHTCCILVTYSQFNFDILFYVKKQKTWTPVQGYCDY